jgi:outer membrane protein assembly factor BamB
MKGVFLLAGCLLLLSETSFAQRASLVQSPEPDWPQFRGPRRDGISEEKNLLQAWPPDGPKLVWSATNIGRGFSAPIVVKTRVFTADPITARIGGPVKNRIYVTGDVGEELHIFAYDFAERLVWKATNGAAWKGEYRGARASVTYSGERIFHENAHGVVAAFACGSGKLLWSVDLLKRFGGQNITWGLSECLLVDERAVYATAGGTEAQMVALDKITGDVMWKSKPLESASYVSPIFVEFAGRRLIVGCSIRNLFCVDAQTGVLQWTQPMPTAYSVLALTPALVGDGIFMAAPHGKGGKLFKLLEPGVVGKVGVEEVWASPLDTCQGGVVYVDGKIIGSFYPGRKGWGAIDGKTGSVLYQNGDFVKGAPLYADGRIYALSEDGWMRLLEATDAEFKVRGQFRLAKAQNDAWAHPVILNGRLYLRYHETLFCYDVRR